MAARRASLPPRLPQRGFEGLLQEMDELRARLLDQYRRELGDQGHQRRLSVPSRRPSVASSADCPELATLPSISPVASRVDEVSRSHGSGPSPAMVCRPARLNQNERFQLLGGWQSRVPAAKLLESWKKTDLTPRSNKSILTMLSVDTSNLSSMKQNEGVVTSSGPLSWIVVYPQTPLLILWSCLSLLLIVYDTVTVPLYTCYSYEKFPKAIEIMDWVARAFWTIDIPLSAVTGFYEKGYVEMRPCKVLQAYLKSWFLFDFFIVLTDWLVIALNDQTGLSVVPVLRGLRFVRVLRLLRLGRLTHLIHEVLLYASDGITILVRILKLTLGLCISIHLIASIWFGLGTISTSGWVSREPLLDSATLSAQYVISVNWVVSQLHGTSFVRPQTMPEMLFQTMVLLSANAFVAVFVASTVQAMMALTDAQSLQMQCLCRRYLRRRHISPDLSHKLQLHFGTSLRSMRTAMQDSQEVENKMVESLPLVLQQHLYEEVRLPLLSRTRLFRTSGLSHYRLLRQLCCDAVSGMSSEPGDLVFSHGDICTRMLVVESGTLAYEPLFGDEGESRSPSVKSRQTDASVRTTRAPRRPDGALELTRGRCLCEASLWTSWANRGELTAEGYCTMLAVEHGDFASTVCKYEFICLSAVRYASCYLAWLNDKDPDLSDLSDAPSNLSEYAPQLTDTYCPFVFISHFKEEAGSDAALIEEGITRIIKDDPSHPAFRLDTPCFLDSNNLDDLQLIRSIVRSSHNMLLLLTDRVLERPWVLIEIATAMKAGVAIQLVQIKRPGVDFKFPTQDDIALVAAGKGLSPEDKALLKAQKITGKDLKAIHQIFSNVALPFSPHRSPTVRKAELLDILSRCTLSNPHKVTIQNTPANRDSEEPRNVRTPSLPFSTTSSIAPRTPSEAYPMDMEESI